jgi:hypothetical protein
MKRPRRPLPEEYSRVTNPERFRPLVDHTVALFARLGATYDVVESAAFDSVPPLRESFPHARPPITLTPAVPDAAPLAVAFTDFPSVVLRYGRWHSEAFPSCGCDACDANAVDEARRLDELVSGVVAGRFMEELRVPWFRSARLSRFFAGGTGFEGVSGGGWTTVSRRRASALGGPARIQWRPWPRHW